MSGLLQDSTGFVFLSIKNKQKWGVNGEDHDVKTRQTKYGYLSLSINSG